MVDDSKPEVLPVEMVDEHGLKPAKREPPISVRNMSAEERKHFERKLMWKLDVRLLATAVLMYALNYLDRNNIAAARLAGLERDLNLKGNDFQLSVSILFVGYIIMQVPSNMLLNKMGKPSWHLPLCMIVWGVISAATAACTSIGGLIACRFVLGFVEAAFFPGALYLLSSWYTRAELIKRTAILYSGSIISGAFSGLIAAGITQNLDGAKGIAAWQWLFIIEGAITVVIAIAAIWTLPDLPRNTRWLSETERELAAWRLEEDIGEDDWIDSQHQSMFHGAKLAFTDPKVYLLWGVLYGCGAAGSVTNFFPTVMQSLGKGKVATLLLTTPPYFISAITILINAWHADKTGERFFHISTLPIVAVVAFIVCLTTSSFGARYTAMCFMIAGIYSGYVVTLGYISNVLPRPASKRAVAQALIASTSNISQIYSPFLYPNNAGPKYVVAFSVNIGMCAMTIIFASVLRVVLVRLNEQLDREEGIRPGRSDTSTRIHDHEEHGLPGLAVERGFRFLI